MSELREAERSPYRFTVSVEEDTGFQWTIWLGDESPETTHSARDAMYVNGRFATEAEARSHAALVLAALHHAEMET